MKKTVAVLSSVSNVNGHVTISTVGTKTAPGSKFVSWAVLWGDGTNSHGEGRPPSTVSHVYNADGNYTIILNVLDSKGRTASDDMGMIVRIDNTPPVPPPEDCTKTATVGDMASGAALAAFLATCIDGDVVCLPAGTFNWNSALNISNKSLTLKGQGIGVTIINNNTGGDYLIAWTCKPTGGITRITGCSFGGNSPGFSHEGNLGFFGDTASLRLDHCDLNNSGRPDLVIFDYVRGVVDHCVFTNSSGGSSIHVRHGKWQNTDDSTFPNGLGDKSWAVALTMGTADQMVFEDNVFNLGSSYRWIVDDYFGARVTYRRNTFNDCILANHGTETGGRERSILQMEYYQNQFNPVTFTDVRCHARGGTGMVYDNVITGGAVSNIFDMSYMRDKSDPRQFDPFGGAGSYNISSITRSGSTATITTTTAHKWNDHASGNCIQVSGATNPEYNGIHVGVGVGSNQFQFTVSGTPGNEGNVGAICNSPFDQNLNSEGGTKCLDQPGVGPGDYLSGDFPFLTSIPLSPVAYLNQILAPIYLFNNLKNSVLSPGVTNMPNTVIENTHFYNEISPFTGAVGVGRGPTSSRPNSGLTAGVGWWSTDENKLYVATGATTWVTYYTPLVYPHPLVT